jgi:hypothetical protein
MLCMSDRGISEHCVHHQDYHFMSKKASPIADQRLRTCRVSLTHISACSFVFFQSLRLHITMVMSNESSGCLSCMCESHLGIATVHNKCMHTRDVLACAKHVFNTEDSYPFTWSGKILHFQHALKSHMLFHWACEIEMPSCSLHEPCRTKRIRTVLMHSENRKL